MRLSHVPLRLATGAFILNSGISKRNLPQEAAEGMQDMAANAVPEVKQVPATTFGKALSAGEIALGTALLMPFVSPVVAGAGLTAFAGGLVRMYLKTPGMTEDGTPRPTQQGNALAKDVWMLGAGLALVIDGITDGARDTAKSAKKRARRTTKATSRGARHAAKSTKKRARRTTKATSTGARRATRATAKRARRTTSAAAGLVPGR